MDDCIFAFFAVEMVIKMMALGIFGSKCYLGDTWNRLDFFIVMAGWVFFASASNSVPLKGVEVSIPRHFDVTTKGIDVTGRF